MSTVRALTEFWAVIGVLARRLYIVIRRYDVFIRDRVMGPHVGSESRPCPSSHSQKCGGGGVPRSPPPTAEPMNVWSSSVMGFICIIQEPKVNTFGIATIYT